jgi:hypothetical protein
MTSQEDFVATVLFVMDSRKRLRHIKCDGEYVVTPLTSLIE